LDKIKSLHFIRDLYPAEQALVSKKGPGVFSFRLAQEPLKLIKGILHENGYVIDRTRMPAEGCAAAFLFHLNDVRFTGVLFAEAEDGNKAHYELTIRLARQSLLDRIKRVLGAPCFAQYELTGEKMVDAVLADINKMLASDSQVNKVAEYEDPTYLSKQRIQ